jgi:nucleoside-diphosphate-sugar epimerase
MWAGRSVAVTGANGYIGSHLVRTLSALNAGVHALLRNPEKAWRLAGLERVHFHSWSLESVTASEDVLSAIRPIVLFHTATHRARGGDREPWFEVNVQGTERLMVAAIAAGVRRVVTLGSFFEYGHCECALHEDLEPRPTTDHGRSKAAATRVIRRLAHDRGLGAVSLRLFTVYGGLEPETRLVPTVLRAALKGHGVHLTPKGCMHDFVHVSDVVAACLRAASTGLPPGEVINVGTGHPTDNHDVVRAVQEMCSGAPRILSTDYPVRAIAQWRADTRRMRALLGWEPAVDLRRGLERTLSEVRSAAADPMASPAGG